MLSIQGVILKIDAYRSFWHALYYFLSAKNTLYGSEKKFLNSFLCLLLLIFYLLYDVIGKYIFNRTKIEQISKWHCPANFSAFSNLARLDGKIPVMSASSCCVTF